MARLSARDPHASEHDRNGGLTHGTSFDSHIAEVHRSRTCRANEIGRVRWYADAVGGYVHDMVVEVNETWC